MKVVVVVVDPVQWLRMFCGVEKRNKRNSLKEETKKKRISAINRRSIRF